MDADIKKQIIKRENFLVFTQMERGKEAADWFRPCAGAPFIDTHRFEAFEQAQNYLRHTVTETLADIQNELFDRIFGEDVLEDEILYLGSDGGTEDKNDFAHELLDLFNSFVLTGDKKIKMLTKALVSDPDYIPAEIEEIEESDDDDCSYAYLCNDKKVVALNDGLRLEYNIHKTDRKDLNYYFILSVEGEHPETLLSVILINT